MPHQPQGNGASGGGGFAPGGSATLADGTRVDDIFAELALTLQQSGYRKAWVDGYQRDLDGAIVTHGYSYREVRLRRYLPGHKEREAEAVLNIRREADLAQVDQFVGPLVEDWGDQVWEP